VDIEAATQHGTVVMNTPGGNTVTTAELKLCHAAVARAQGAAGARLHDRRQMRTANCFKAPNSWAKPSASWAWAASARRSPNARAPSACASSPTTRILPRTAPRSIGAEFAASLDAVYLAADFVTVHMPVTPGNRSRCLNAARFAKMKPGVKIVNCARGEIIVENDLIAASSPARWRARHWTFMPSNRCRPIIRIASSRI